MMPKILERQPVHFTDRAWIEYIELCGELTRQRALVASLCDGPWQAWDTKKPLSGTKVALLCDDGCSISTALIVDADDKGNIDVLDGEDAMSMLEVKGYLKGALWTPLPLDYPLAFMEADDRP